MGITIWLYCVPGFTAKKDSGSAKPVRNGVRRKITKEPVNTSEGLEASLALWSTCTGPGKISYFVLLGHRRVWTDLGDRLLRRPSRLVVTSDLRD